MANRELFWRMRGFLDELHRGVFAEPAPKAAAPPPRPADALNGACAPAYRLPPKQALAQYAATGCFQHTFYATAGEQLDQVLELCAEIGEPRFVAQVAIHARLAGLMKDMPAMLCAWLSVRDPRLHEGVFRRVIDSPRMLRTYVQIVRCGVAGRRSFGTAPKRLIREWLRGRDEEQLFRGSTGQSPSLVDIVKMVHPKPEGPRRESFYGYLLGREHNAGELPELVRQYERFKNGESLEVPDLPLPMLTSLPLGRGDWQAIARHASWQTTRMNLNTFARHGVFEDAALTELIAERLRNPDLIRRARAFPYQLLAAYQNADLEELPSPVRRALADAMEIAVANVPSVEGGVVVCPDVSGSMRSPITGYQRGSSSAVLCVDVAALMAAALARRNRAVVLPFEHEVVRMPFDPAKSVLFNAGKLASVGGGGTNCSAPLRELNRRGVQAKLVVLISDNESWVDAGRGPHSGLMAEWSRFRRANPEARLVCLDLQPNRTTQAYSREDILNVGGFSDQVFELIADFAAGRLDPGHWVARIESIEV